MLSMLKNRLGLTLEFDAPTHTYRVDGKVFTSVTKRIESFCEPFDTNKMARICSMSPKYEGKTETEIIDKWEEVRENGTTVHERIEKYLTDGTLDDSVEFSQFLTFLSEFKAYFPEFSTMIPEQRLYDTSKQLSGTADFVAVSSDGKTCILADWKTSRVLRSQSSKMCQQPYESMPDTNLSHYILQLNYYRDMLEKWYDVKVVLKLIVVFNKDNSGFYCRIVDHVDVV